jgi:hypothetical protein
MDIMEANIGLTSFLNTDTVGQSRLKIAGF